MNTFLQLLPIELNEVKEYHEPVSKFGKNDHKVGVMSEDLKKLYTLWNNSMRTEAMMKAEREFGKVADPEEYDAKLDEISQRAEILRLLFWFALKTEHDLWCRNVGVREGFVVVWSDEEPNPLDFLRHMFEEGK